VNVLRRSLLTAFDDGCLGFAKGAAYSALLAFFPVLASAATIFVEVRADFVASTLETALRGAVPPGSEDLVVQQFKVSGTRPFGVLVVAALISLWAASGVINSLVDGFQVIYRVPRNRGFFHQMAVAMALVLASAVPLVFASLLILFGGQVEKAVLSWMKVDPIWTPLAWLWQFLSSLAQFLVAFLSTATVTACLYYFGPYRRQRWRFVWPGAILATVLWLLATLGFAWYVRNVAHYNVMYGSVGVVIALLVWMYLIAVIAMIGCEFNAEYERSQKTAGEHPVEGTAPANP
jgi:membrane protein